MLGEVCHRCDLMRFAFSEPVVWVGDPGGCPGMNMAFGQLGAVVSERFYEEFTEEKL